MANNDALHRAKRFYKVVEAKAVDGGFGVFLDGRKAKTPSGSLLALPTRAVADLVAAEWDAQGEWIMFNAMPACRHAFTAIDRVSAARAETAGEVARFAGSDLLCYFAVNPVSLIARENERWGPMLDWAQAELGLTFIRVSGVLPQAQPPETLSRVEQLASDLDDFSLAGLAWAAALFGSSVLAFALQRGRLTGEAAFELARLDETFQEERWGVDEEAARRAAGMREEAVMLERWFGALR